MKIAYPLLLLVLLLADGPASLQRKLEAAAARMIALGVAPALAKLFADPYREPGSDTVWSGA